MAACDADDKVEVCSSDTDPVIVRVATGGPAPGTQPVSIANGADATLGALADAAVDTDAVGTVSGKLRGLVKLMVNLLSRWPAALGAGGGLKVEGVAGGVAQPVSLPSTAGVATHTADVTVDGTAGGTQIIATNANRKAFMVQVISGGNARVSIGGTPTATTGIQVTPGGPPLVVEAGVTCGCPIGAVKAIREGSVSAVMSVVEFA